MKYILFIFFPFLLVSQNDTIKNDTVKRPKKYLLIPVVFKSPETGWAVGLSGAYYFKTTPKNDSTTRSSIIQSIVMFTQRGQNIQAIDGTIYFPHEKNILYLQSSHSFFPDYFWGLGQNTKNDWRQHYAFEHVLFSPHIKHKVRKHIFLGAIGEFQYVFNVIKLKDKNRTRDSIGIFDTTNFLGKQNYLVSGLGFSLGYDTRNSNNWPTKGIFVQTVCTGFNQLFLSTFNLAKVVIDARVFKKTFYNQVVAFQFYNYSIIGQVPLREFAGLGGANNLRGFYTGRYRANCFYSLIAEYRMPIYKRFACVLFGGMGDVYDKVSEINIQSIKYAYGGGLRIELLRNERLNLRLDYGYSDKKNKGFYFTVGECF